MKVINENKITDSNSNALFDSLSQEFEGGSFYGLEYVLEDVFENTKAKPLEIERSNIDWFGLYQ